MPELLNANPIFSVMTTTKRPDISVVVPLYNEAESLPELIAWIDRVIKREGLSGEVIFVDDGSTDSSWNVIEELKGEYPYIRAIGFMRNYGKSAALYCGFDAAEGEVVMLGLFWRPINAFLRLFGRRACDEGFLRSKRGCRVEVMISVRFL